MSHFKRYCPDKHTPTDCSTWTTTRKVVGGEVTKFAR